MADERRVRFLFTRAESEASFVARPCGRYVAGDSFVLWCRDADLQGFAVWGDPSADQVRRLFSIRSRLLHGAYLGPHRFLVDLRRLERVGAGAFAEFARFVSAHADVLSLKNQGMAVVRPRGGLIAAMVAGYPDIAPGPFATHVATELDAAISWLTGAPCPTTAAALESLYREIDEQTPLLPALRALLAANPASVTAASAARLLSTSRRTLARRLAALGTSFRREVREARRLFTGTTAPPSAVGGPPTPSPRGR